MRVAKWTCHVVEGECPLTCPACGEPIPNQDVANGDFCYSPIWADDTEEIVAGIHRALGIEDPVADFFICRTCFSSLHMLSPLLWLEKWVAEDSKMVSRKEALTILDGLGTRSKGGSG